jgi:hypothetical protein
MPERAATYEMGVEAGVADPAKLRRREAGDEEHGRNADGERPTPHRPTLHLRAGAQYNPLFFLPGLQGGVAVVKKLALVTLCVALLGGSAWAQDAKTVIASAKKALGDPTSITYSGSAKDVAFQQCGANATAMNCQGTNDPMRPIAITSASSISRRPRRATPAGRTTSGPAARRPWPRTLFQQVTPQQADVSQPWARSLELHHSMGLPQGAEANNATVKKDGSSRC